MTRVIKMLAALLISTVLIWLSVGFVLWNWSPETWAEGARFIFVAFSFILAIPAVVIFALGAEE